MNRLTKRLTQQLGKPSQGLWGWLVNRYLEKKNRFLEVNAVKLCNIQPESVVLEVGFGPGLGLQEAAKRITYPKGKLYGVDYSDYMHSVTSRRLQADIRTGKVTLFLGSVEHIPLEDNVVDRVFHCNCYYFWPNQRAGSKEIHRVMKPESNPSPFRIPRSNLPPPPSQEIRSEFNHPLGENIFLTLLLNNYFESVPSSS
ncbi:arsenite methyltransferase-like isoform X2 [Scyliorhinus canicula]|uniref:arsenite methyltransferase-like isoform X2 n=1 Tax=Scyliorhinus canicula TaxID=7830 RepID=UPI0018F7869A|nr:arsenite methyltransferase-like isoform X2 [Scyliorhinus canicula]